MSTCPKYHDDGRCTGCRRGVLLSFHGVLLGFIEPRATEGNGAGRVEAI